MAIPALLYYRQKCYDLESLADCYCIIYLIVFGLVGSNYYVDVQVLQLVVQTSPSSLHIYSEKPRRDLLPWIMRVSYLTVCDMTFNKLSKNY